MGDNYPSPVQASILATLARVCRFPRYFVDLVSLSDFELPKQIEGQA